MSISKLPDISQACYKVAVETGKLALIGWFPRGTAVPDTRIA
jgi:hypothetical protein